MQGLTDEQLNDRGRDQARAARERIGEIDFDAVYSSPLRRAVETGATLCDRRLRRGAPGLSHLPGSSFPSRPRYCQTYP